MGKAEAIPVNNMTQIVTQVLSGLSLVISFSALLVSLRNKRSSDLESRWRHLLDVLDTIKPEWRSEIDDTGPGTLALIVGTSNLAEPSLESIRDRLRGHTGGQPLDTPPALYDTFRALARLYPEIPKKKRGFFNDSLAPHASSRHVGRGLVQALEKRDSKTIMFLIESGLLRRFTIPISESFLGALRHACLSDIAEKARKTGH